MGSCFLKGEEAKEGGNVQEEQVEGGDGRNLRLGRGELGGLCMSHRRRQGVRWFRNIV